MGCLTLAAEFFKGCHCLCIKHCTTIMTRNFVIVSAKLAIVTRYGTPNVVYISVMKKECDDHIFFVFAPSFINTVFIDTNNLYNDVWAHNSGKTQRAWRSDTTLQNRQRPRQGQLSIHSITSTKNSLRSWSHHAWPFVEINRAANRDITFLWIASSMIGTVKLAMSSQRYVIKLLRCVY
jgi:hypothetical protein